MPVNAVYKLHSIVLDSDSPPGPATTTIIGSMASVAMPTDAQVVREVNAGNVFAEHSHTNFSAAMINMTTWNLGAMINALGPIGFCINTTNPQTGVHVYVAKYDCNQIAATGHVQYTIRKGLIYPTQLSVDHQQNVQLSFSVMAVYDGTNEPLTKTDNATLPTIPTTPHGPNARWTMDDTTVGGVALVQKQSINIDFGQQANTLGADSEAYDSWASLDQHLPTTRFLGIDPNWWTSPGGPVDSIAGTDVNHADTTIYFKKRKVAKATTEHVKIDTGGTAILNDAFSSNGNEPGRTDLRIDAVQIGANAPLVITPDVAIP